MPKLPAAVRLTMSSSKGDSFSLQSMPIISVGHGVKLQVHVKKKEPVFKIKNPPAKDRESFQKRI